MRLIFNPLTVIILTLLNLFFGYIAFGYYGVAYALCISLMAMILGFSYEFDDVSEVEE